MDRYIIKVDEHYENERQRKSYITTHIVPVYTPSLLSKIHIDPVPIHEVIIYPQKCWYKRD